MRIWKVNFLIIFVWLATACATGFPGPEHSRWNEPEVRRVPAFNRGDIVIGMDRQDVLSSWGKPAEVETAGDPAYGNQKWIYYTGLSSPWNGLRSARMIYFENGQVAGWETNRGH